MDLSELLDLDELEGMIEQGYVSMRESWDDGRLRILNYTNACAFDRVWNPTTLASRGLIYRDNNDGSMPVLARPFLKFFNHSEVEGKGFDFSGPVTVSDKLDGSMGVAFSIGGGPIIATRGSFHSDQATHANHVLGAKYRGWQVPAGITPVFEIIYPENRIVVNYGDYDDLVLLGGVDIETGEFVDPDDIEWSGPRVEKFEYATYLEALAAPDRPNREGLVVYFHNTGERVKIKQEDYVALHALISNVSTRAVWENLRLGTFDDFVTQLPDEFQDWCVGHANMIRRAVLEFRLHIDSNMRKVIDSLPRVGWTRKDFALKAQELGVASGAVFASLDGNEDKLNEIAWKAVEPEYEVPGGMP